MALFSRWGVRWEWYKNSGWEAPHDPPYQGENSTLSPNQKSNSNSVQSTSVVNDPYRNNLSTISSSFATLLQYTLTLAELNAKLEAELLDNKSSLVESRALNQTHGRLEDDLVHQLHAAQLAALNSRIGVVSSGNVNNSNNNETESVNNSLEEEIKNRREEIKSDESVMAERDQLKNENEMLRDELAKTTGDLYAARLASKYSSL